eukprot:487641-Prymnesium_polylepis.1
MANGKHDRTRPRNGSACTLHPFVPNLVLVCVHRPTSGGSPPICDAPMLIYLQNVPFNETTPSTGGAGRSLQTCPRQTTSDQASCGLLVATAAQPYESSPRRKASPPQNIESRSSR